jgi:hypothetical protein
MSGPNKVAIDLQPWFISTPLLSSALTPSSLFLLPFHAASLCTVQFGLEVTTNPSLELQASEKQSASPSYLSLSLLVCIALGHCFDLPILNSS